MSARRRGLIAAGLAVAVAVPTVVVLVHRPHGGGGVVRVASDAPSAPTEAAFEPSSTSTGPSISVTTTPTTPAAAAPTTPPPPPWTANPTTGLTNLQPVTISARDLPPGPYVVGQCPADIAVPDVMHCAINGHPGNITVDDGTLQSTVRVYRFLGNFDCASAAGACAVGFMNQSLHSDFSPVGFPITFDAARPPRITVSPVDGLTDGQTVEVRGFDLGEADAYVGQCMTLSWASCEQVRVRTEPDGTFRTSLRVRRNYTWGGHGPGSGACDVDGDCILTVAVYDTAFAGTATTWDNFLTPIVLHFAPIPTTSTTVTGTTTT